MWLSTLHIFFEQPFENLQPGQLVMLTDFSENYRCRFQNEAQHPYFDQQQVKVHQFMTAYIETSKMILKLTGPKSL